MKPSNNKMETKSENCTVLSDHCSLLTELIFPKICLLCQSAKIDDYADIFCSECLKEQPADIINPCQICGGQNDTILMSCQECLDASHPWSEGRTLKAYRKSHKKAIHLFKYSKQLQVGQLFIAELLKSEKSYIQDCDLITYVPLHGFKYLFRGFNQAHYIARGLAQKLEKDCPKLLARHKWTSSQTKLNRKQRLENNLAVFKAVNKDKIKDKTILLVDDVMTTGATMHACASKLLEAGAVDIKILTLARG